MHNNKTTLVTFKNFILVVGDDNKLRKGRVTDVLESVEAFKTFIGKNKIVAIRARMSWLSADNRDKLRDFTEANKIELIQIMTDPSIVTDLDTYFEEALVYVKKTQPKLTIEEKDIKTIQTLVEKYNKKSIIATARKF